MAHVANDQNTRAAKTAETGDFDSLDSCGCGWVGGSRGTGALAIHPVSGSAVALSFVFFAGVLLGML